MNIGKCFCFFGGSLFLSVEEVVRDMGPEEMLAARIDFADKYTDRFLPDGWRRPEQRQGEGGSCLPEMIPPASTLSVPACGYDRLECVIQLFHGATSAGPPVEIEVSAEGNELARRPLIPGANSIAFRLGRGARSRVGTSIELRRVPASRQDDGPTGIFIQSIDWREE